MVKIYVTKLLVSFVSSLEELYSIFYISFVLLCYLACFCVWCCFCTVYGCSWLNSFCIISSELSKHSNLRSIFGHFWLQKSMVAIKMLILWLQKQKSVSDILMLIFLVASVSRFLSSFWPFEVEAFPCFRNS